MLNDQLQLCMHACMAFLSPRLCVDFRCLLPVQTKRPVPSTYRLLVLVLDFIISERARRPKSNRLISKELEYTVLLFGVAEPQCCIQKFCCQTSPKGSLDALVGYIMYMYSRKIYACTERVLQSSYIDAAIPGLYHVI